VKTMTFVLLFVFILSACGPAPTPTATPIPPTATVPPPTLSSPSDTQAILAGNKPPQDLEQLATETYSDSDFQQKHTFPFTIQLASNLRATWAGAWCATTQAILDQNMKQVTFAFSMNGQPVALSQFYEWSGQTTDDSGKTWACRSWSTVVSNWPKGATTALQTVLTFASKINDGMYDHDAGQLTFIYTVTLP
jgi:hypothetical protein